ncbi:serine/threonine-protein kinase [Streptomyces sp. SL13]|uniref:non-specific serine/threonine protein kinase n=1 Tax=Streptantibioticus silvisoli TaxID=2705255 RepID=A0AA90K054_9ACTN|nr:serine/threonine-protein kinase [Streptantibioticus silvisoli]MDI5972746.1 serine/threonine-protein kinase [Streptantibioticus silvisoli]
MTQEQVSTGHLLADRYRLGEVLGKGGMGTVWRAVDETLGRTVAVKELRFPGDVDDDEKRRLVTRTLREAKATARIRTSGAVTVFDVVEEDDRPWIVMELVEGRSLSDAIRADGPLPPRRAAEVGLAIIDVLRAAHREGILHRDVKPSNVLIAADGRVVLTDFGIAQVEGDPSVTSTGMLVGAPSYISPERARGQRPGPPADLWSLGVLLYATVTGRPPYDKGSAIATLTAVMTEPFDPPGVTGPLAEAINGLLIKDPAERLDDAGVRDLLTRALHAADVPEVEQTRAMVIPADPQPRPTDLPPADSGGAAARPAAAVNAGGVPLSGGSRGGPGNAATLMASSGVIRAGGNSRRKLALAAAAVVVVVVVAVLVAVLTSGGGGGKGKGKADASAPAVAGSASPHGGSPDGGTTGRASGAASPSTSASKPSASGPASAAASGSAKAPAPGSGAVPAGYVTHHDAKFHFSMAMPAGWHQTAISGQDSGAYFGTSSSSYPQVLVDYSPTPGKDAAALWRAEEPAVARTSSDYHNLGIHPVSFPPFVTAADWQFTRSDHGQQVHVINRGFADHKSGYAIMLSCPAAQWNGSACQLLEHTFFATFKADD